MSNDKISTGKLGEKIAADYLIKEGYKICDKNFRTKFGEIDIIGRVDGLLAFIEVKTRIGRYWGLPQEAVNFKKQNRIIRSAFVYMHEKNLHESFRIDVVAVQLNRQGETQDIELIRNAVVR